MTIYQELHKRLVDSGLFEDMATEVMDRVKRIDYIQESMGNRWNESTTGYPPALITGLWLTVRRQALVLIDEKLPQAWFRSLFVDNKGDETR